MLILAISAAALAQDAAQAKKGGPNRTKEAVASTASADAALAVALAEQLARYGVQKKDPLA